MMTGIQAQAILELRRRGCTYADIAAHVGASVNTVKSYCLRNERTLRALAAREICRHCGAPIAQRPGMKRRSFCSAPCRGSWWKAHRALMDHRVVYRFTCLRCGAAFEAYDSDHRKYCSRQCYHGKGEG